MGFLQAIFQVSIRSPRQARGDALLRPRSRCRFGFNPLPSPKQGEIRRQRYRFPPCQGFQSAPLAEARGDGKVSVMRIDAVGFNPLPSPKQGEIRIRCRNLVKRAVSIRSPRRSKGRSAKRPWPAAGSSSFNPLPSPKQGEIWTTSCQSQPKPCFNPLPSPKQGEMQQLQQETPAYSQFQSAPLAEARGDRRSAFDAAPGLCFNPLPSPKQGEIHALPPGFGRLLRFNPLPSPKQGEMPTAVTGGTPMGYAGGCAMRPNDCHEFPIRLSTNAITRYRAVTCRLREYAAKTPLLGFRACYKISGASKFTGSSIP